MYGQPRALFMWAPRTLAFTRVYTENVARCACTQISRHHSQQKDCLRRLRATSCREATQAWGEGKKKRRLDDACVQLAPQYSKNVILSFILSGKVFVNDIKVTKAGYQVPASAEIDIRAEVPKFVSRAGFKLEKALDWFDIDVSGLVCLDAGLSTGGFTDCLLQRGAKKVFGVDVGYGDVHNKIRSDPRVVLLERTNLRHMPASAVGGPCVDLFTLDLSFISVLKVLPAVNAAAAPGAASAVVLVKPQFEAGLDAVGRGGVVWDAADRENAVKKVAEGFRGLGWESRGVVESPVRGAKGGNIEFLAYFVQQGGHDEEGTGGM